MYTGTVVVDVSASDNDASWPNNAVTYMIESGSHDDFIIDSITGLITVSSTSPLTAGSVTLTVAAVDAGCPPLKSTCHVNVNVLDGTGRRPPVFQTSDGLILVSSVNDQAPVGHVIYTCVVLSPGGHDRLRFHWLNESQPVNGYDVTGRPVTNHTYLKVVIYTNVKCSKHIAVCN